MKPDEPQAFHILRHCLQKILTEDVEVLRGLGLSFEMLRLMEALTVKELVHLSRLGSRFLGISLDPQGFDPRFATYPAGSRQRSPAG
jgi:hypothetical protein